MKFIPVIGAMIVAAGVVSPASAQTSACRFVGNISTCSVLSNGADANPAWQRYSSFQELERLRMQNRDRQVEDEELAEARKAQGLREEVGGLIADGNCADARKAALRGGDLALAEETATFCKAPARGR